MQKKMLILLPFLVGLLLVFYSWYISYPIAIDSPSDFLFNHISPYYWFGLSLIFATLYGMAILSKRDSLKWIVVLGIITFMYSSAYFYWFVPGSDSHYFRGLTEYFVETGDLSATGYRGYFQWPLFFIFSKMAYSLGLDLRFFEFILFGLLGFIYTTSLYSIFHKSAKDSAPLVVISFFILMWYYFNYQFAPFSLAIGLVFILFMLDSRENKGLGTFLSTLTIFVGITLIHSFAPVFFILYTFIKYILSRDRKYQDLFITTLIIYLIVLTFQAVAFFSMAVQQLISLGSTEYARFAETLLIEATTPLDELAQMIGRIIFITTALIAVSGFVILLFRRKVTRSNLALFLSGTIYGVASALLPILGVRAFVIIGIPLSLGITYFQKTRFKFLFQLIFLVMIVLFAFVPLHSSFSSTRSQIIFQTNTNYQSANFLVDHYDPIERKLMGSDSSTSWYLATKIHSNVSFGGNPSTFFDREITDYDCILFTIALQKSFFQHNYTTQDIMQEMNRLNSVYTSGTSYIFVK